MHCNAFAMFSDRIEEAGKDLFPDGEEVKPLVIDYGDITSVITTDSTVDIPNTTTTEPESHGRTENIERNGPTP